VHLVPVERRGRKILDEHRVCQAIEALSDPAEIATWAGRFAVMGDPSKLTILMAIDSAGPISVTDLAVAVDMNDTTVSQALRLLRATGTVVAQRDGRIMRYRLADDQVARLLTHVTGNPERRRRSAT
jgi:ArsR family transcriptional regulator, lead/cadmium/zinc/bismuth-responsive transcriptional repressor